MHHSLTHQFLANIWSRHRRTIGRYCAEWIPKWGSAGEHLSILGLSEAFLTKTMPAAYTAEGLNKICGLPDGKDFLCDTIRRNTALTRSQFSSKMKATALRCISWMTAAGLSYEHTDLFFGRCTEERLVELWGPRFKDKLPAGWSLLADRGFWKTARFYPKCNPQLTPKFLKRRLQFTEEEVCIDMVLCKLRYTCEVGFARVTTIKGLRDRIAFPFFVDVDAMNHWGHAMVNLMKPLI